MNKAIIIDIDDCAMAYSARLREYVNNKHDKKITGLSPEWDVTEWLELGDVDGIDLVNEFGDSWEFGTLDPMPGAVGILNELAREGYTLIAVTACGNGEIRKSLRMANLYNVFGPIFEEVIFVELGGSKEDHIERINSDYDVALFVDDRMNNLSTSIIAGRPCVLFKQPHNRKHRGIASYDAFDWYSIKQFLKD